MQTYSIRYIISKGRLAQGRAHALQAGGHRFKSYTTLILINQYPLKVRRFYKSSNLF